MKYTKQDNRKKSVWNFLVGPSARAWKSRVCQRVTLVVFMTTLLIQGAVLALSYHDFRHHLLDSLSRSSLNSLTSHIRSQSNGDTALQNINFDTLIQNSIITGIRIFEMPLKNGGDDVKAVVAAGEEPARLDPGIRNGQMPYKLSGTSYEVVFETLLNGQDYIVTLGKNATEVRQRLNEFILDGLIFVLLSTLIATIIIMYALGRWLLEPVLFLRDNLVLASQNQENPQIPAPPHIQNDEIGKAITIAQNLIRSNADNIKQIKSTAQDKIHKLAYYDTLTGLPNRTLFVQKLTEQARNSAEKGHGDARFAVIALDLDHFKDINDTMGHNVGDAILRAVSKRLRNALPVSGIVARAGEDEFAITMPLTSEIENARDIGWRVRGVVRNEPFQIFNEHFQIRCSIGVATFPDDAADPDQVLKNADIALNRAKEEGRDMIREYVKDFDRDIQQRFQILRDLRDAMENDQLDLYYQPQLDLNTGQVIGAEALLRWWKPDDSEAGGQFISPGVFIPIAEQSGLIIPLGEWVLECACAEARKWHDAGKDIRVAVNVSGAQFHQGNLVDYTKRIIKDTGVDPSRIELEVTESVFMEDIQHTVETLQELHAIGIELAIDDFGTGYSSLSYLRQFPIDRLKIDQSFIRNALIDSDDAVIAKTIIRLGHSLSVRIIAEGVETREHEKFLMDEGCDEVQGFRYCKPVPSSSFTAFLENYPGRLDYFNSTDEQETV